MAPRVRKLKARQVERILIQLGFELVRKKGSHKFYKHPDGRYTVIPFHSSEDIGRGLLRQILREVNLSVDELIKLL